MIRQEDFDYNLFTKENNSCSQLIANFIQTQEWYATFLDKLNIFT